MHTVKSATGCSEGFHPHHYLPRSEWVLTIIVVLRFGWGMWSLGPKAVAIPVTHGSAASRRCSSYLCALRWRIYPQATGLSQPRSPSASREP